MKEATFEDSAALGADEAIAVSPWVVMKFGGTSVGSAANWETIAALLRERLAAGLRPVLVHSALGGVSNDLEALLAGAVAGEPEERLERIRSRHLTLAAELGLDGEPLLKPMLDELGQLVAGIRLVREVSPRTHVRVLALGELLATRLGAAWLRGQGLDVAWLDARDVLRSRPQRNKSPRQHYLSAVCDFDADPELGPALEALGGDIVLTQGFIARNADGETVVLGRGGSDTTAAYLAARLQARRLEIWTDVPGMFSADPRMVPSARLLSALHYDEAQEIASTGGAVLHPRALPPVRRYRVPLFIRATPNPALAGTVISAATAESEPRVKAVSLRPGLMLVSMEGMGMWQEVGFLADAFAVFSRHGLSVDLVSTSESNVTVSIDTVSSGADRDAVDDLLEDLARICRVRLIEDCAAVSLVGRKIRTILHRLGPALEVFADERIHLLSQAASDLNLSFVVDEAQGYRLVQALHASTIGASAAADAFGPSWEALHRPPAPAEARERPWWWHRRSELVALAEREESAYVYDLATVDAAVERLLRLEAVDAVFYAMKANSNPEVLRRMDGRGVNFECVSPAEIARVLELFPDIERRRILFTPNFAPRHEYVYGLEQGVWLTLDNLHPLRHWPELFREREVFIRLDPGHGRGHHEHVKTAGMHAKFGVPLFELDELAALVAASGCRVKGLHAHSGSGVLDADAWAATAHALARAAERFPEVETLDLGGGLGVPEKPGDAALDLDALDETLKKIRAAYPQYRLWLEPGRYLVAQAGALIARVTQTKGKGGVSYVGVATGMNSLIRPALYGAYHEIVNLTRLDQPATETVTVVGPNCETGDRLGNDRLLPPSSEGDVLLIANAGAYGYVMSSRYNLREPAREIVI